MNLQKQQDFLARLLTDENLRRNFLSEPEKIGAAYGLTGNDVTELSEILPEQLAFFSDSLFWKRMREAEKFLPLTKRALKDKFPVLFRQFSETFQPHSVKKHLEDAVEFCRFLQNSEIDPPFVRDVAKYEQGKLEFFGGGKRFVCKRLQYPVKEAFDKNDVSTLKKKLTFAVWLRIGGKNRYFLI